MKPILFFLLSACILLGLSSCEKVSGEGPVVTEVRSVTGFSGIDSRVSADVFITKGAAYSVEVRAQQNILNVMRTYESNGSLVIRFENDVRVRSHEPIQVFVTMPELSRARLSGSGDIRTTGDFQPNTMHLDISGSGNIEIAQLTAQAIDATISGSGNIKVLSGTAQSATLKISGSGSLDLSGVQAQQATTRTSGSGSTRIKVAQSLNVTISGSGSVYYRGNPVISTSISGSGKVLPF